MKQVSEDVIEELFIPPETEGVYVDVRDLSAEQLAVIINHTLGSVGAKPLFSFESTMDVLESDRRLEFKEHYMLMVGYRCEPNGSRSFKTRANTLGGYTVLSFDQFLRHIPPSLSVPRKQSSPSFT